MNQPEINAPPIQIDVPVYPGQRPEDAAATMHAICGGCVAFFDDEKTHAKRSAAMTSAPMLR